MVVLWSRHGFTTNKFHLANNNSFGSEYNFEKWYKLFSIGLVNGALTYSGHVMYTVHTVKTFLKDSPRKGHCTNYFSTWGILKPLKKLYKKQYIYDLLKKTTSQKGHVGPATGKGKGEEESPKSRPLTYSKSTWN